MAMLNQLEYLFFMAIGFATFIVVGIVLAVLYACGAFRRSSTPKRPSGLKPSASSAKRSAHPVTAETGPPPVPARPSPLHDDPKPASNRQPPSNPLPEITAAGPSIQASLSRLEEAFAGKWFVWLGAATLGLAGFLMIREMAEQGYFPPSLRVALAFGVGILLTVGGEWLRRRPMQRRIAERMQDFVPSALVAAGLLTCLASTYASTELYQFIGTPAAMMIVSALSLTAFALSMGHGPLVALLGLVGGFAAPIAVSSGTPNAYGLFGYLSPIVVGALAVAAIRGWGWLTRLTLAIATIWGTVWIILLQTANDVGALVMFAGVMGTAAMVATDFRFRRATARDLQLMPKHQPDVHEAGLGVALSVFLTVVGVVNDAFSSDGLLALALYAVVISGAALFATNRYKTFASLGLAAICATLTIWSLFLTHSQVPAPFGRRAIIEQVVSLSTEQQRFLAWAIGFGIACAALSVWQLLVTRTKTLWAGCTCAASAGLFGLAYLATTAQFSNTAWAGAAFAIAAGLVALAARLYGRHEEADHRNALSWLTFASGGMIFAGLAILLGQAWLTIALSALVPLAAAIAVWSGHRPILLLAGVAALTVLFRLIVYPVLFDYAPTALFGQYWVIYGYGLPFLAFAAAHHVLQCASGNDPVARLIDVSRTALFVLFYSATVRAVLGEPSTVNSIGLLEASAHLSGWLAVGYFRLRSWIATQRLTDLVAANFLLVAGSAFLAMGPLLFLNPLLFRVDVAGGIVFSALTVGLLLPGLTYLALGIDRRIVSAFPWLEQPAKVLSLVLIFVWATVEVRHGFHMTDMRLTEQFLAAEQYAYSAVWLILSLACFVAGIRLNNQGLRFGGLTIMSLTVAKVFLLDLAALEGLLRVGSFFGLGLSLIAIGFFYQHFVLARKPPKADKRKPA